MDSSGNLYFTDTWKRTCDAPAEWRVSPTAFVVAEAPRDSSRYGQFAPTATLDTPFGVAVDTAGNVYIADSGNARIRMVNSSQTITTFAGNSHIRATGDNGPATSAGLTVEPPTAAGGSLYFADTFNNKIRKIDLTTKIISTVAGIGTPGFTGDGGPAFSAQLSEPTGVAVDAAGNLFIADWGNSVIREVSGGKITTIAGIPGQFQFKVDTGTALGVPMDPERIVLDKDGSIYVADELNDRIRKLTLQTAATLTIALGNNQSGAPGKVVSIGVKVVDASANPGGTRWSLLLLVPARRRSAPPA